MNEDWGSLSIGDIALCHSHMSVPYQVRHGQPLPLSVYARVRPYKGTVTQSVGNGYQLQPTGPQ